LDGERNAMKAVIRREYGAPEVLEYCDLERPEAGDDEVLVSVKAVSLNLSDWEGLTGKPLYVRIFGLFKPRFLVLGTDVTGVVESVGKNVTRFVPGDEVYGDTMGTNGALSEFAAVAEKMLHKKPVGLSFEDVSTIPQAGIIALQGLRWGGRLKPGQKVLINGAGGGSGMFAIQMAKMAGAEVTGVDNEKKLEHMRSVGADHVVDYRQEDFCKSGRKYDHILDLVATRSVFAIPGALAPGGSYAMVGGKMSSLWAFLLLAPIVARLSKVRMGILGATPNGNDFQELVELLSAGKLRVTVDRTYGLPEVPEAIARIGDGDVLGKLVITP